MQGNLLPCQRCQGQAKLGKHLCLPRLGRLYHLGRPCRLYHPFLLGYLAHLGRPCHLFRPCRPYRPCHLGCLARLSATQGNLLPCQRCQAQAKLGKHLCLPRLGHPCHLFRLGRLYHLFHLGCLPSILQREAAFALPLVHTLRIAHKLLAIA